MDTSWSPNSAGPPRGSQPERRHRHRHAPQNGSLIQDIFTRIFDPPASTRKIVSFLWLCESDTSSRFSSASIGVVNFRIASVTSASLSAPRQPTMPRKASRADTREPSVLADVPPVASPVVEVTLADRKPERAQTLTPEPRLNFRCLNQETDSSNASYERTFQENRR